MILTFLFLPMAAIMAYGQETTPGEVPPAEGKREHAPSNPRAHQEPPVCPVPSRNRLRRNYWQEMKGAYAIRSSVP